MDINMNKIVIILLLALAAGPVEAQKRNVTDPNAAVAATVVVVDRFGVTPTSLTRPVGPFLLCVRNRRGNNTEHFSLTLDSPGAAEIYSLDTTPRQFHGTVLVDLQPGHYRLRLTNSPELSVAITIE
jgi:hypothetical protein